MDPVRCKHCPNNIQFKDCSEGSKQLKLGPYIRSLTCLNGHVIEYNYKGNLLLSTLQALHDSDALEVGGGGWGWGLHSRRICLLGFVSHLVLISTIAMALLTHDRILHNTCLHQVNGLVRVLV